MGRALTRDSSTFLFDEPLSNLDAKLRTQMRRGSQTGGFGIGIPKNAENKEAAFLLMQWLTSKQGDKLVAMAGGNPS